MKNQRRMLGAMGAGLVLSAIVNFVGLGLASSQESCNAQTAQDVKTVATDVLTAGQILCILEKDLLSSPAVAAACGIDQALVGAIDKLRADARSRGIVHVPTDAGPGK